ncbi:hypothetical protein BX666DRAFT_1865921 [Dichotomocladium elegans]|nr:hypothetical protein BX666DRAFT_1865921 [Dichotomocladium elegans]
MTADSNRVAQLKAVLAQQKRILEGLQSEQQQYEQSVQALTDQLESLRAKREQRQSSLQELQANYDKYLRSLRATGDDLESVRDKIEDLKRDMADLAAALVAKADVDVATEALSTFWLNLNGAIKAMCPLSPQRLQMLTEKFMMDVLVQNLNLSVFPGLEIIEQYNQLQYWLDDHNNNNDYYNADDALTQLPIRLRQEVALIVHKTETDKSSDVYRARHAALQNNWKYLYSGLVKAYPFVYQHDKAEPDVHKHYGARVQMLVEKTISLGLAIKGMEEDITAAAVMEGEQPFEPDTMIDEDGQEDGIVAFCICPPFVVGNIEPVRTLLKGRVLCVPMH